MSAMDDLRRGLALLKTGESRGACLHLDRAAKVTPDNAEVRFLAGLAREAAGYPLEAAAHLERALQLDPANGEAALRLGLCLRVLERPEKALAALERAVSLLPGDPAPLVALGTVLLESGRVDRAGECFQAVLAVAPESFEALEGLGGVALARADHQTALDLYGRALALNPDSAETWNNLGVAHKESGDPEKALEAYERARTLAPDDHQVLCNMANAWQKIGDMDRALGCFRKALVICPDSWEARWGEVFGNLRVVHEDQREVEASRRAYEEALMRLDRDLPPGDPDRLRRAAICPGANQPFYLTYQGENDRDLQEVYGRLVNRVMEAGYPEFAGPSPPRPRRDRIRLGVVCGFLHEHSVWKIPTAGWAMGLDRERFEVVGYYTAAREDHCTEAARKAFDILRHEPHDFRALCRAVREDAPDVLLYPEVGMDPASARLAGMRLAPVQAVSLGHPMTTGLPTMDYFLSSEHMEPPGARDWYTEKLVLLPGTSVYYDPLRSHGPAHTRQELGLPTDRTLVFCPQNLSKYLPVHDHVFPDIAALAPDCVFVFLLSRKAAHANRVFQGRIEKAFRDRGSDPEEHLLFLPQQKSDRYHSLNHACDLFLDSIGWSGFNTAMEAANCGLPIVACPTGGMRGRHTAAVLTVLGHEDCMAGSVEEYVRVAADLVQNPAGRRELSRRILAGRDRLFRDRSCLERLATFLESAVKRAG